MISRAPALPAPSDKLQVTNAPIALPGRCVICNRDADGKVMFIDFNWSLDNYGAVYFCFPCLVPLSHVIGFVETEKLLDAERECEEVRFVLEGVEDELRHYRSIVDSLGAVRPDLVDITVANGSDQESGDSGFKIDSGKTRGDDRGPSQQTTSGRFEDLSQSKFQP